MKCDKHDCWLDEEPNNPSALYCPLCEAERDVSPVDELVRPQAHIASDCSAEHFERVFNWQKQNFTCAKCGTGRSVKYKKGGKPYCNMCVLAG